MRVRSILLLALAGCPSPKRPDMVFAPAQLAEARVGQPYHATITVSGNVTPVGGFQISSGSLPEGLKFTREDRASLAVISGTPEKAARTSFTVSVWCYGTNVSGQTAERRYELIVR